MLRREREGERGKEEKAWRKQEYGKSDMAQLINGPVTEKAFRQNVPQKQRN